MYTCSQTHHNPAPGAGLGKALLLCCSLLVFAAACGPAPEQSATEPDPADPALVVARNVLDALGGAKAWEQTRHIRFNFFGRRTHHWDKWTGRHRLEGNTEGGQHYVVLHNVLTRAGDAFLEGRQLQGEEADEWRDRAYRAWVNDTYWLVMPYKLRDPGVLLSYEGTKEIEGQSYDVLHLRFESVGLTPGDQYWAYVNRDTRLMDRWAYLLESMKRDAQPVAWQWADWQTYGRIRLAPVRLRVEDGLRTELSDIAVFDQLPDSVYGSPQPVAP